MVGLEGRALVFSGLIGVVARLHLATNFPTQFDRNLCHSTRFKYWNFDDQGGPPVAGRAAR